MAFCPLLTPLPFSSFLPPFSFLPSLPFSLCSCSLPPFLSIFFSLLSPTSLALLALALFIFSCAALISVTLVLCAISNSKNKFYMLHSSTYTPVLILFLSNNSLANISGTYKLMHAIEKKNKITH